MEGEQQKRHWQFSIRDVLLIMLIVGLAVGWFVNHQRLADELDRQQLGRGTFTLYPTLAPPIAAGAVLTPIPDGSLDPSSLPDVEFDETITDPPPVTPIP